MTQERFEYEVTRALWDRKKAIDDGLIPEHEISDGEKLGRAHRITFEIAKQIMAKRKRKRK